MPISVEVSFEKAVFKMDTIKKAAYRFTDKASFDFLDRESSNVCIIQLKDEKAKEADEIVMAFKTEVLDQDLREKVFAETEAVRNLVLAHTFSNTGITSG